MNQLTKPERKRAGTEFTCPKCGKVVDCHINLSGTGGPRLGDLTVCFGCYAIWEYGEGVFLPPPDDLDSPTRELLQRAQQELRRVKGDLGN